MFFLGKEVRVGEMRLISKIPKSGVSGVESVRIFGGFVREYEGGSLWVGSQFWQARKWVNRAPAEAALARIQDCGFDDFEIMERDDI